MTRAARAKKSPREMTAEDVWEWPLPEPVRQAEMALLAGLLRSPEHLPDALAMLSPNDFGYVVCRAAFEAMAALFDGGRPVDLPSLAEELHRTGRVEDCGGYQVLADLYESHGSARNTMHYAGLVRDHAMLRRLHAAGRDTMVRARLPGGPASEALEAAERALVAVAEGGLAGGAVSMDEVVQRVYDRVDRRQQQGPMALPTGFADLDELLCGLHPSELVVVAARPSCGKTALAANLAARIALAGGGVYFASLEQPAVELGERMVVAVGGVSAQAMRKGRLCPAELSAVTAAGERLRAAPLAVDDANHQTVLRIGAGARRVRARGRLDVVVVDYLQIVAPDNPRAPRQEQVAGVSRRLKALARQLGVPVVALAQLSRAADDRSGQEPRLSDLRESGAIEADADVVILLHRLADEPGVLDLIVAKQRNGPTGTVRLAFDRECVRFDNHVSYPPMGGG